MIQTLLKSFRRGARPPPPAPPAGSRVYAIGDIHGRADLLARLHRAILADAAAVGSAAGAARRLVVYIGDYIDRGLQSCEVIDLLLDSALPGFEAVHLKGNHEDMLLRFLDDPAAGPLWLANGGDATLASYGIGAWRRPLDIDALGELRGRLARALPARHEAPGAGGRHATVHRDVRGAALVDLLVVSPPFLMVASHGEIGDHRIRIQGAVAGCNDNEKWRRTGRQRPRDGEHPRRAGQRDRHGWRAGPHRRLDRRAPPRLCLFPRRPRRHARPQGR
jgi:hypothetical protein